MKLDEYPPTLTREEIYEVILAAARRQRLTVTNVLGPRRFVPEVHARHEIINELRANGETLKRIAGILGMDHSSVLYHLGGRHHCRCMVDAPSDNGNVRNKEQ